MVYPGGFYAIYNGPRAASRNDLITNHINLSSGISQSIFPTFAPTIAALSTLAACTICPDGTPVPLLSLKDGVHWRVQELDSAAAVTTNESGRVPQHARYGCHWMWLHKLLYYSMSWPCFRYRPGISQRDGMFPVRSGGLTCQDFQTQIKWRRTVSTAKTFVYRQPFLEKISVVAWELTAPAHCRICEPTGGNPSTNPPKEGLLTTEIVHGVRCRDITGITYTLKREDLRTDSSSQLCPAYLSIGACRFLVQMCSFNTSWIVTTYCSTSLFVSVYA